MFASGTPFPSACCKFILRFSVAYFMARGGGKDNGDAGIIRLMGLESCELNYNALAHSFTSTSTSLPHCDSSSHTPSLLFLSRSRQHNKNVKLLMLLSLVIHLSQNMFFMSFCLAYFLISFELVERRMTVSSH